MEKLLRLRFVIFFEKIDTLLAATEQITIMVKGNGHRIFICIHVKVLKGRWRST